MMQREITLDSINDRLVFLMSAPDQDFWEALWRPLLTREAILRGDRFVTSETKRVLPKGSRVIDAGCGIAATVAGLQAAGFDACGIDNAEETVREINRLVPELKVEVANVLDLPFETGSLDGIWSLGVIEHFYDGFAPLIEEARRVLRPGGYLFLTVPSISPLKSLKRRLGCYPPYDETKRAAFFQFAFPPAHVVDSIEAQGFRLQRSCGRDGSFGFFEDAPALSRALMLRDDATSLPLRAWWRFADLALTPFSYHIRFFLFQKTA